MKKYLLTTLFLIPFVINAQSLGKERVQRLKESVVRILVGDSLTPVGTGFFVMKEGYFITCYHVIESAFEVNKDGKVVSIGKITIEFYNGERVPAVISTYSLEKGNDKSASYDFCLLKTTSTPKTKFTALKLGNFNHIEEGDMVYTCGYPLGIKQYTISSGILSTKWVQKAKANLAGGSVDVARDVAWLDVTMNRGAAGGPLIKLGKTPAEDEVIGIAVFTLNPSVQDADRLMTKISGEIMKAEENTNNEDAIYIGRATAIASNSTGLSGCISINYVADILAK